MIPKDLRLTVKWQEPDILPWRRNVLLICWQTFRRASLPGTHLCHLIAYCRMHTQYLGGTKIEWPYVTGTDLACTCCPGVLARQKLSPRWQIIRSLQTLGKSLSAGSPRDTWQEATRWWCGFEYWTWAQLLNLPVLMGSIPQRYLFTAWNRIGGGGSIQESHRRKTPSYCLPGLFHRHPPLQLGPLGGSKIIPHVLLVLSHQQDYAAWQKSSSLQGKAQTLGFPRLG